MQKIDGDTYLGIVCYVVLSQSVRGVHPWFIWNGTNNSINTAVWNKAHINEDSLSEHVNDEY